MKIWFTADTHFGHVNVIRYNQRPFSSVDDMDESLIENWNQSVSADDLMYHLGDFTLLGKKPAEDYFQRLNGKIHITPGGHDQRWLEKSNYISGSGHPVVILAPRLGVEGRRPAGGAGPGRGCGVVILPPLLTIKIPLPDSGQSQLIVLCHYSLRVWDRSHYGSWHLYGHSHGNLPPLENSLDVGVD